MKIKTYEDLIDEEKRLLARLDLQKKVVDENYEIFKEQLGVWSVLREVVKSGMKDEKVDDFMLEIIKIAGNGVFEYFKDTISRKSPILSSVLKGVALYLRGGKNVSIEENDTNSSV